MEHTDHPLSAVAVLLLGFLGALAPEICRLYRLRGRLHLMKFSRWYFGISVLYALLGGVVSWILPAVNYYAAFYAGVTWPVMVTAALHRRERSDESIALANSKPQFANEDMMGFQVIETPQRRSIAQLLRDHADGLF